MKIITATIVFITFSSCANLRHATNTNLSDLKNISHDIKWQKKINRDIKTISSEEAENCRFIQDHTAKDNVIDQGEKFAVLYLKLKAEEVNGNAVLIKSSQKVGDYGHSVEGIIYRCDAKE